jgi:tetratricopeptide (TPR) repeat protein
MKTLVFMFLSVLLGATPGPDPVQAMKAALPALQGRERTAALLDLVNKIENNAPQDAIRYAAEGIPLAKQQGDQEKEAAFLSSTAYCYSQTGDLSLAVQFGKAALELGTRINNKDRIAKAHNTLGITYTFMGAYSQAIGEHLEALRIREELANEKASLQSLNNIGIVYHHSGQFERALDYYNQILQRIAVRPDPGRLILTKLNMGFVKYKQGKLDEALKLHLEAQALAEQSRIHSQDAYTHLNLGLTYTDLKAYDQALANLNLALGEYELQDLKHGRVQVLNALGRVYSLTGKPAKAISFAKAGASLAEQINARDELKACYELLSELYAKQGNLAESYRYFKQFTATKDSIFSIQESSKIADVSMKIVSLKKDNEIESLKKEQVISALKLEKGRYRSVILGSSLLFLVTIVAGLASYSIKVRNNKISLKKSNLELEQLNAELHEKINEIKTLSGLLPICAQCKKIRNDSGYWEQLEGYISEHTSATFSHGICPHCAEDLYPEAMKGIRARHEASGEYRLD